MLELLHFNKCSHLSVKLITIISLLTAVKSLYAQSCTYPVAPEARYELENSVADTSGNNHAVQNTPNLTFNSSDKLVGSYSAQYNTAGMQLNDGSFHAGNFTNKSVSMFIKVAALPANGSQQIIYDEGDATDGISLTLEGTAGGANLILYSEKSGALRTATYAYPSDGNWHHIGFVYEGAINNMAWLYFDGYPVRALNAHGNLSASVDDGGLFNKFGNSVTGGNGSPNPFTGLIDEVAIFSSSLTPKNMLDIATDCGITDLLTAQGTMVCDAGGYLVHTDATTDSLWRTVDLATGVYTQVDDNLPTTINSIGYNIKDDRIWGYNKEDSDGRLSVSVLDNGGNWTTQLLGTAVGLSLGSNNLNVGTIDANGDYFLTQSTSGTKTVLIIDLDPSSAGYYSVTDTFIVTWPGGQTPDWAINPTDGHLYAINYNLSVGSDHPKLLQIIPSSGGGAATVTDLGNALSDGSKDNFGGVYFDDDGFFYIQGNTTGKLYRLDLREDPGSNYDENLTAHMATGTSSTENDGTRCISDGTEPPQPTPRDFGDISAVNIKTALDDDGARHALIQISGGTTQLMIGSSIDAEDDAVSNATASAEGADDDGVSFSSSLGGIITATVSVTNTTGSDATLCGWFDADADGLFESSERQCTTAADPDDSYSWTLTGGTNNYFSRFRLCDLASDCAESFGVAANGEVEDYLISYNATSASIIAIRLDGMTTQQIFAQLRVESLSSGQLIKLLSLWNPALAQQLTQASDEELIAALRDELDPDGDEVTAVLRWETRDEHGTAGFMAQRKEASAPVWHSINRELLPGLIDAPQGGEYMLFDPHPQSGKAYQYQLIEQEVWGSQKRHGPYSLQLPEAE